MMTEKQIKRNLMHNFTEKQRTEAYELVRRIKDYISDDYNGEMDYTTKENKVNDIIDMAKQFNMVNGLCLVLPNFTDDFLGSEPCSYEVLESDNSVEDKIRYYMMNIEDHGQLPTSIFMEFILRYNSDYNFYKEKIVDRLKEIYPWRENGYIKPEYKDGWYYGSYYKTEFVDQ